MTKAEIKKTVASVFNHAQEHFTSLGLSISSSIVNPDAAKQMELRQITVMIGMSGPVNTIIAFTFDLKIGQKILTIENAGLSISEDEYEEYLQATMSETANIILGHCTQDLANNDHAVILSPPIFIENATSISQASSGVNITNIKLQFIEGDIDIDIISQL